MNPNSLEYRLTEAEREQFERDGYFIVEDALTPEMVGKLTDVVDKMSADESAKRGSGNEL